MNEGKELKEESHKNKKKIFAGSMDVVYGSNNSTILGKTYVPRDIKNRGKWKMSVNLVLSIHFC